MKGTLAERFWAKVGDTSDCWTWIGGVDGHGYGAIYTEGRVQKAHRVSYEMHVGPIPGGMALDHLCRNPACVNPDHLEPVTWGENTRRGDRKTKQTHCKNGHEFTPENTARHPNGGRQCRQCQRDRNTKSSGGAAGSTTQPTTPKEMTHA